MSEYTLAEFAIFYKRIMTVENCLKALIISKYTNRYGSGAYGVLCRYFRQLDKIRNQKNNTFSKIENSKGNIDKLSLSMSKMYLSEVLNIFQNPVFLKNKVRHNFFQAPIATNDTNFQKMQKGLNQFRNCIAHFNDKKLLIERSKFVNALAYFENILCCNCVNTFDMLQSITNHRKLSTVAILHQIFQKRPDAPKDDKLLISLFDDIALVGGYTFESLPQRWTIIRQKFVLQKQYNGNP